jgi:hypothetical protein
MRKRANYFGKTLKNKKKRKIENTPRLGSSGPQVIAVAPLI